MALLAYAEHLIPDDVKDPVTDFLESGLHQVVRVFHGPRPRKEIPSGVGYKKKQSRRNQQLLPWQRQADEALPSLRGEGASEELKRHSRKQAAAFVLASLPTSPLLFADTEAAHLRLRLLSDTVRHIFAGTAARTMSQAFIHPIDTVKTRLQINKLTAPVELQNWRQLSKVQRVELFLGRRRVLSLRNWAVQGPVDLYRGLTGAVLGTIPVAAVYFSTYEASKNVLERRGASGAVAHLASASVGAVLSAFVRVPTDTLKHRTQAYIVPNIFQGARSIVASQGIGGLYHGLLPTLLRDVPELALQFSIYETLRRQVETHRKVEKLRTWEHLALGGLSGAAAASATMPLDVAKTALQCGDGRSISLVFREVVREKGVAGLFAGMGPRVAQIALQGAIFFTLFEAWKAQLKPLRFEDDRLMVPKLWRKRRGHVWKRQFVFQ